MVISKFNHKTAIVISLHWASLCVWLILHHSMALASPSSKAFDLLSPYRAGLTTSLRYVASHYGRIYGDTPKNMGGLQAISPRLGLPGFVSGGQILKIEYLGKIGAKALLEAAPIYFLIPHHLKNCDNGGCFALGTALTLSHKPKHADIHHFIVKVIIPKNVAPGFYDLLHLIPKSARKTTKAQESVDKHEQASSRPTETGPTKRDTPTSAEIRKSKRAGEQQSAGDTRSADNTAANYFSVRVERAVGVYTRPPQQFDRFQFVHLTDLHLRNGEGFRLMHVIRSINSLQPRPAFAVLTGDIVEYGNQPQAWAKSIKYLRQLEIPLFIMIGNHDYYRMHFGQPKAQVGLLREEEGLHLFVRHYHPFLAYRFRFGGYNWLSVDTGTAATTKTWYQLKWVTVQGLGQEQLRDIREFLHKPARHGHILLAHASPRAHLRNSAEGCDMGRHGIFIRGRKELEEIMINAHDKHKRPIVYFFGHTHWNSMYARPAHRSDCRFLLIPLRYPMMGELPCWHNLPIWRSPLLISTQSATKHQPLRSGGILQKGSQFGEGAGAAYGFRLIDVNERTWKTAIYRFYYRTRIFSRKHDNGYIDPRSRLSDQLPQCKAYK